MAKITITIEGDPQETRSALVELLGLHVLETVDQEGQGSGEASWTPDELSRLWHMIRPEARRIWGEIAKRPEGYAFWELQRTMGMGGLQIAGRLSSMGHVMRQFPGKPHPLTRDYAAGHYRMAADAAEVIRQLAEDSGE